MAWWVGRSFPSKGVVRAVFGRHAAAPSSLGKRTRLYAAMARVNSQPTLGRPRCRAFRSPAPVLAQPNAAAIRVRIRWLTA